MTDTQVRLRDETVVPTRTGCNQMNLSVKATPSTRCYYCKCMIEISCWNIRQLEKSSNIPNVDFNLRQENATERLR